MPHDRALAISSDIQPLAINLDEQDAVILLRRAGPADIHFVKD
jgi:hypothetical protein